MGAASQELTERAKLLISERRYQEAVRACRRALLSQPEHVDMRLLLGEALLALERYDEVRVEMLALARKAPRRAEVQRILGEAYLRDSRPDEAVAAFRKALEINPNDTVARELLTEASEEHAPVSQTIERWFSDEAKVTQETGSPGFEEDATASLPLAKRAKKRASRRPKKQSGSTKQPSTSPSKKLPERRPKGAGQPDGPANRDPLIFGRPNFAAPPPSNPPPPLEVAPRSAPSTVPPPLPPREPPTESISVESSLDSGDLEEVPTRARANPFPNDPFAEAPTGYYEPPPLEPLENEPTRARGTPLSEMPGLADVPEEVPTSVIAPQADVVYADERPRELMEEPPTRVAIEAPPAVLLDGSESAKDEPGERRPSSSKTKRYQTTSKAPRIGRKKAPLIALAVVVPLVVVAAVFGVLRWTSGKAAEELREAAQVAGDSGLLADYETLLEQLGEGDDAESRSLRARVLAAVALEHDPSYREPAEQTLAQVPEDERTTDATIALALLSIEEGDPRDALGRLRGLRVEGDQIAEAFRARGLATSALGQDEEAVDAAEEAAQARPNSPRHVSLHALTRHLRGDSNGGLTLLSGVPQGDDYPSVRVTRARILQESGGDWVQAEQEARAVTEDLAERAARYELAWAHLLRARHAAANDNPSDAAEHAQSAAEHPPPSDERFGLTLVETFLNLDDAENANTQLERLPQRSMDPRRRTLLEAEVALAIGELERASNALGPARGDEGPRRTVLRAEILTAQDRASEARPLYERASRAPGPEGRRARVRMAAIYLDEGEPSRAVDLLEQDRSAAPDDVELITLLSRAYISVGREPEAQSVLDAAIQRRPDSPDLLAAQGSLQLHRGQVAEALASLSRAAQLSARDPELQANLGDAARRSGDSDQARQAYERALELRENHPQALLGLGWLALDTQEYEDALERVEAAGTGQSVLLGSRQIRAEVAVARGRGAGALEEVSDWAEQHRDARLYLAVGHLASQAEQDREGRAAYGRVLALDSNNPDALLGRSLLDIRRGRLGDARSAIDAAEQEATERDRSEELAPRIAVARARVEFEFGRFESVRRLAAEALEHDSTLASPHLLLANVAMETGNSPNEHLQRAVQGREPPPEALGQYVTRIENASDRCDMARRYMTACPRGYDAPDVRRIVGRCQ